MTRPVSQVGLRVYVPPGDASSGLPCRTGTVHLDRGSNVLVRHDDGRQLAWGPREYVPCPGWRSVLGRLRGAGLRAWRRVWWGP